MQYFRPQVKNLISDQEPDDLSDLLSVQTEKEVEQKVPFLVGALFIAALLLAPLHNTWLMALGIGSIACGIYGLPRLLRQDIYSPQQKYLTSGALGLLSSLIIFQLHGAMQAHFLVLALVTSLILYKEWRVLIPIVFLILLSHYIIAYLYQTGYLIFLFPQWRHTGSDLLSVGLLIGQALVGGAFAFHLKKSAVACARLQLTLEQQLKNAENNINYAKEIALGNFDVNHDSSEQDVLGLSLVQMSKGLKKVAEEDKQRNWEIAGIAKIGEILRLHYTMEELAYQVIAHLVKYLNAVQGGIYIMSDDTHKYLELKGCYAYDKRKHIQKRIDIGEGLIGQVALEQHTIYLTEIPQDYLAITSGLGESNPTAIIIMPLKINEEVVGALEIASFQAFDEYQRSFLEKVTESIASSITSSRTNDKTNHLLRESQMLAEQLRAQEEEMRQNMEELEATQEDLERKSTEREEAQKELLKSQGYLHNIINAIPNPIFVKDRQHKLILANDAYCQLMGSSREEVLSHASDQLTKEATSKQKAKEEAIFRSGLESTDEETIQGVDQVTRTIISNKALFRNEEGEVYLVGAITDITERKQIEEAFAKEKYLLDAFMNNTPDFVYFKDEESRFVRISKAHAQLFGYDDPKDLIGKSDFDFFSKDHSQPAYDDEQRIMKTGKPIINMVEKETWEDGRVTWVSTTKMPLLDLRGKTIGTFGVSRNVSDSKNNEIALEKKERRFQALAENSSDIQLIIGTDGIIKFDSPSFHRELGHVETEVMGHSIAEFVHPDDLLVIQQILTNAGKLTQPRTQEFRCRHAQGHWLSLQANFSNWLQDELVSGVVMNALCIIPEAK
ncbi:MAG: PAS domain S-box protein [Bacteroidota bacterium]